MEHLKSPLFFVTTDPLKATGLETIYDNFHIVCIDYTPLVDILIAHNVKVFCYEKEVLSINELPRNTRTLLLQPKVQEYILANSVDEVSIMMFKPNFSLDKVLKNTLLSKQRTIVSMNNPAKIASEIENKLYFLDFCNKNDLPHPRSIIMNLHSITYSTLVQEFGTSFVIQFDRGWFGNRTFFITTENELTHIQQSFTDRQVKVSEFIDGITLTNNVVISNNCVIQSYPFEQITDDSRQLARLPGSSIGNQWSALTNMDSVSEDIISQIKDITDIAGKHIARKGFKGFLGFDFIISEDGKVYLQEANARFTASAYLMSQMEQTKKQTNLLQKHLELYGIINENNDLKEETASEPLQGSRIVARHTDTKPVTIKHSVKNGVYYLEKSTYTFKRSEYRFETLADNEFQLFTVANGREVTVDQELFQLQSKYLSAETLVALAKEIKQKYFFNQD